LLIGTFGTMKLKKFLDQSYPIVEDSWKVIISISCFISLFLLIFQPFELSKVEGPYRYLIFIGYGAVTFLILVFNMKILPSLFKDFFEEKSWTVKKQLLFFGWILFTIGIGNFIYTVPTTSYFDFNFKAFILFQVYTLVIGLFPVTFLVIIQQNYLYRQHLQSASELNTIIPRISANGSNYA
jgi:membrane protein YdbS with pleckstrin-like domain